MTYQYSRLDEAGLERRAGLRRQRPCLPLINVYCLNDWNLTINQNSSYDGNTEYKSNKLYSKESVKTCGLHKVTQVAVLLDYGIGQYTCENHCVTLKN